MTTFMAEMNIWLTLNRPYNPENKSRRYYRRVLCKLSSTLGTPTKSDFTNKIYMRTNSTP